MRPLALAAFLIAFVIHRVIAAEVSLSETIPLPMTHSIGWVRSQIIPANETNRWDGKLDEAKWGTPSTEQGVVRNWNLNLNDDGWRKLSDGRNDQKKEDASFELWIADRASVVRGIVVISGHGSGTSLFTNPQLRKLAQELNLALFKFIGNPVQRGFWPRSLLSERIHAFAEKCAHPELDNAPLFLYGHSNGTGFSAIHTAGVPEKIWGWVSMRPGITFQVYQPAASQVPGLVIFGEDDPFLSRPSKNENLAIVEVMRKQHSALWNYAVEPKTGHGPGNNTWSLVFSFLRHSFAARVPASADPKRGPVTLKKLEPSQGYLGQNWDLTTGGFQTLPIAPFEKFSGDRASASWLLNPQYAADWQMFQSEGCIR